MTGATAPGGLHRALVALGEGAAEDVVLDALCDELRLSVPAGRPLVAIRTSDGSLALVAGRSIADAAEAAQVRALGDVLTDTPGLRSAALPETSARERRSVWFYAVPSLREPTALGAFIVVLSEVRSLRPEEALGLETCARMAGALLDNRRAAFVSSHHRKLHQQLSTRERLATVGAMAASIAHEINSPLASVSGNVAVVLDEVRELEQRGALASEDVEELLRALGEAKESAARVATVVRDLVMLARDRDEHATSVDVRQAVAVATRLVRGEIRQRARLEIDVAPNLVVHADEPRVVQVLVHLLREAIESLPDDRPDRHEILIRARHENGTVAIEVHDSGKAPTEEGRERAFEPFFSLRGGGSALGLSVCQDLLQALDGRLLVLASPLGGACFRTELPATARGGPTLPPALPTLRRVLVVDDEPMMCAVVARMLRRTCRVTTFTDAREALASVLRGDAYDAVLCDVMMPGMSGIEFLEELGRAAPALARRTGFLTAGAFTDRTRAFLHAEGRHWVDKPVDIPTLTGLVDRLVAH